MSLVDAEFPPAACRACAIHAHSRSVRRRRYRGHEATPASGVSGNRDLRLIAPPRNAMILLVAGAFFRAGSRAHRHSDVSQHFAKR